MLTSVSAEEWEILGKAAAALTTVFGLLGMLYREHIKTWWLKRREEKLMHKAMPSVLTSLNTKVDVLGNQVSVISAEMHTNGGSSLRDAINRLEQEHKYAFWHKPFPAFRITHDGRNLAVSQAFMDLVKTSSETDLKGHGWRSFTFDPDQTDKFFQRWLEISQTQSHYAGLLKMRTGDYVYRGEWLVKIFPLGTMSGEGIFSGAMYPSDDVAKKIATEYKWFGQTESVA